MQAAGAALSGKLQSCPGFFVAYSGMKKGIGTWTELPVPRRCAGGTRSAISIHDGPLQAVYDFFGLQFGLSSLLDWGSKRMIQSAVAARTRFAAVGALAWLIALSGMSASEADGNPYPPRGRVVALMTALFHHDTGMHATAEMQGGNKDQIAFVSASPEKALSLRERAKVVDFAKSLVYEGGYYPKEIYALLGYKNVTTARTARLFRQLDEKMGGDAGDVGAVQPGSHPSPWEVAGRVGRSGMSGVSDHWAMAPGAVGDLALSTPGTLAYLPSLAVVYSAYHSDGLEAAAQLAILKDDDMRAAPVARAAAGLLLRVLTADAYDKDAWLRAAAKDSRDGDTEQDLRAVRVKDWRYLRGEECAMGRLERAVFLWYKGNDYESIMAKGGEMLRSRESLAYLASLAAATYGQESLPGQIVNTGATDRQLLELINDLYDLATSEAVLQVAPQED